MPRGRSSHSSTGKISSQRESGVQDMSYVSPILATRGRAQKAAMVNPQPDIATVRQKPFRQGRTNTEAMTTTRVVRMWERAVAARASAAHLMYLRSSRTALMSSARYTNESAKDHE